jgi:hypothetical protein
MPEQNFESSHNHSAYALIERDKTKPNREWGGGSVQQLLANFRNARNSYNP